MINDVTWAQASLNFAKLLDLKFTSVIKRRLLQRNCGGPVSALTQVQQEKKKRGTVIQA